jgi:hypothetical protein
MIRLGVANYGMASSLDLLFSPHTILPALSRYQRVSGRDRRRTTGLQKTHGRRETLKHLSEISLSTSSQQRFLHWQWFVRPINPKPSPIDQRIIRRSSDKRIIARPSRRLEKKSVFEGPEGYSQMLADQVFFRCRQSSRITSIKFSQELGLPVWCSRCGDRE